MVFLLIFCFFRTKVTQTDWSKCLGNYDLCPSTCLNIQDPVCGGNNDIHIYEHQHRHRHQHHYENPSNFISSILFQFHDNNHVMTVVIIMLMMMMMMMEIHFR